jgi:ABC-type transport system involved in multi-copper enzyme maturation permease subunit
MWVVIEETIRRHVVRPGYVIVLILLAMTGMFGATFNTPGQMWPWLVTALAIVTGSAIIGPELSTGTLQLIVSKPLSRSAYLCARVAGVFASVGLAAVVGFTAECVARVLLGRITVPWQRLTEVLAGALLVSFLAIALLTLLGSLTRSYFNVAIYLGAQAALSATETIVGLLRVRAGVASGLLNRYPGIERGLIAFDEFLFPAIPAELHGGWMIRLLATAIVSLVLACLAFDRREVPYGPE